MCAVYILTLKLKKESCFARTIDSLCRFDRMAAEDITIQDIQVKKGTAVTVSAWTIQRDPEVWENPMEFDPDRSV